MPQVCILTLLLIYINIQSSRQCGPGSETSRNRARRPMVLYQRLPDVDEDSITGSGMFRKMVTRDSNAFKEFVVNRNKDIVFDGNGSSNRLMTKRCSEKLNKLAVLVKREWPKVKLRVIGAYDEHGQHPPNSLHYEGRAVDITTSDRDRLKNGALGVLAYRAGFDWVFYESSSFIHASVIAENEVSLKYAECFPGTSKVITKEHGYMAMEDLQIGHHVLTYKVINEKLSPVFTEVIGFLDSERDIQRSYLRLETSSGTAIEATRSHILYTVGSTANKRSQDGKPHAVKHEMSDMTLVNYDSKQLLHKQSHLAMLGKEEAILGVTNEKLPLEFLPSSYSPTKDCVGTFLKLSIQEHPSLVMPVFEGANINAGNEAANSIPTNKETLFPTSVSKRQNAKPIIATFANSLTKGNQLLQSCNNLTVEQTNIAKVTTVTRKGAFAPLTNEGTLVVDDIFVSCFAKTNHTAKAHAAFAPFRLIATYLPTWHRQFMLDWYVSALIAVNDFLGVVALQ